MKNAFRSQCVPRYSLLTEEQIIEIHHASLEILETIGVRVEHEAAVQLLREAGCRVKDHDRVQIPNWLVEESIGSAPSRITVYNRKGKEAMRLEGHNSYFGLGTDLINTYNLDTRETRRSLLQDVINAARIADYSQEIDFIASFALPTDVLTNAMYVHCARTMMENSTKPIFFTAGSEEDLDFIIEMAAAVAGGEDSLREKPFVIHYSEPTAPLRHSYGAVRKLFLCADKGIPVCYTPGDMLGASAPTTLAGGIVQANAEALSGIVLHQLKRKGSPIVSGFATVPLDMRTAVFSYGAPEFRLTNSAFADLYHYYGIPTTLMAALDGANLIHDVGYLGQGLLGNPAAIVMCDEIISYVKRILRGFDLSREKMGIDVIRRVGPGGNYLTEKHTLKHFRQELWQPKYMNRENPEAWSARGGERYEEIVTHKASQILATHQPEPLQEEITHELDKIVGAAEEKLGKISFVT